MYQALYRKYRPQTFDEVVGQASVTQTLKAQLISGKLSHAYLFTGSRGTGKTSCAKILAKAVNCLHLIDGNPCNHCAACRSIDSGSCMDVLEIDAASNNGVDNVRALRDDAIYAPAEVKKRVYIIDEVHMLSISAFNALLKIIEEPPEHLLFILATTELHKVPATILSRCQRFSFKRLLPEDIAKRINYVAYQEGIDLTPEAANLLARLADGALRDGMSLLDQCAASAIGTVDAEKVYDCLGLAGSRRAAELLGYVAAHDTKAALALFSEQYAGGKDIAAMLDELVSLCRDLLILRTAPKTGSGLLTGVCTDAEYKQLYPRFTAAELLRLTKLLQETASGFNRSANRRIDAELCLMQMCDPQLDLDAQAINARLSRVEQQLAAGVRPVQLQPLAETAAPAPSEPEAAPQPASPPKPRVLPDELPVGFWAELIEKVTPQLDPAEAGFFSTKPDAVLRPVWKDDTLLLCAETEFTRQMADTQTVRQAVSTAAEALLHTPIRVRVVCSPKRDEGSDKFEELLLFAKKHPNIINIKT